MTVTPEADAALTAAAVAIHDADCPDTHCSGAALGNAYRLARVALEAAELFITGPAVAAERERCAALLEARAATTTADLMAVGWSRPQIAAMRHLCHAVAKEIRNGSTDG